MPFQIVRNDITRMHVDAIVNAANERLRRGGGVCGAIFAAAGVDELQAACDEIGHCPTGASVATPAFRLPARHVIHTVGPVWQGGAHGEEAALRSCYLSALELAASLGDTSIAFPLISSGIYGYPKDQAIDVALAAIRAFLDEHEMGVYLAIFDAESLRASTGRFGRITQLINDHYARSSPYRRRMQWEMAERSTTAPESADDVCMGALEDSESGDLLSAPRAAPQRSSAHAPSAAPPSHGAKPSRPSEGFLKKLLKNLDASFSTTLLRMIDERGLKDSEVYKRANISRQHFSKIRSNPAYRPKKHTVLALAVALQLSTDETRLLLERAGFALTHADERDVIVEYYLDQHIYDIYEINLALYAFDQPLLC